MFLAARLPLSTSKYLVITCKQVSKQNSNHPHVMFFFWFNVLFHSLCIESWIIDKFQSFLEYYSICSVSREASYCPQRPEVKEHSGEEERDLLHCWPRSSRTPWLSHRHHRHRAKSQSGNQKVTTCCTDLLLVLYGFLKGVTVIL